MSCDTSVKEVGILSPVASPAPQAKQHTTANLTGDPRKVKDLAADFHNLVMKWRSLNSESMDVISRIANTKIEKVFNVKDCDSEDGVVSLPPELNPLCDLLGSVMEAMSKIEAKMQHKSKMAEGLESLQQFQKSSAAPAILFSSMTIQDVANTLKMIHGDFQQELKLKKELCRQVAHADTQELLMFYCACWMHEPYISPQCQCLLDALLIETGHLK